MSPQRWYDKRTCTLVLFQLSAIPEVIVFSAGCCCHSCLSARYRCSENLAQPNDSTPTSPAVTTSALSSSLRLAPASAYGTKAGGGTAGAAGVNPGAATAIDVDKA